MDLTIPQILVMGMERPPGGPERITSAAQYLAVMAEREERENSW